MPVKTKITKKKSNGKSAAKKEGQNNTVSQLNARIKSLHEKLEAIENAEDRHIKTEKRLRKSQRQLKEAQRVAIIGSWEWNIKEDKVSWSDELYRIFGFKPNEFKATYKAFLDSVHPDDKDFLNNAVKDSIKNGTPYEVDARILRHDGSLWIMRALGEVVYDKSGLPLHMRGTAQDITKQKMAEEAIKEAKDELELRVDERTAELRNEIIEHKKAKKEIMIISDNLQAIIRSSPLAIIVYGNDSKVLIWNPSAERIFGWKENEVLGKTNPIVPPEKVSESSSLIERVIKGESLSGIELARQKKDGSLVDVSLSTAPVKGSDGNIISTMAIFEDISEIKATKYMLDEKIIFS